MLKPTIRLETAHWIWGPQFRDNVWKNLPASRRCPGLVSKFKAGNATGAVARMSLVDCRVLDFLATEPFRVIVGPIGVESVCAKCQVLDTNNGT